MFCAGSATLDPLAPRPPRARATGRLGTVRFHVASGHAARQIISLTPRARKLLRGSPHLRVVLHAVATDLAGHDAEATAKRWLARPR
jgi:hypothetical protein